MHQVTYFEPLPDEKEPAISDEKKIFKCKICPDTHRGFVSKSSLTLYVRRIHNSSKSTELKRMPREKKSKKAKKAPKTILDGNSKFTFCRFIL